MIHNRINNGTTFKKYTLQIVFFFFSIKKYVINITAAQCAHMGMITMGILHNRKKKSRTKFDAINSLNLNFKRFFFLMGIKPNILKIQAIADVSAEKSDVEHFFFSINSTNFKTKHEDNLEIKELFLVHYCTSSWKIT